MPMNNCPHPRCKVMKLRDHYACHRHWMMLPLSIKRKVLEGFKEKDYLREGSDWHKADYEAREYWK